MPFMSTVHLRGIDLNLLIPPQALLEERNVTRAAARVHLTQSAMSRALERLRETLQDDLLVRSKGKYELTLPSERSRAGVAFVAASVSAVLER